MLNKVKGKVEKHKKIVKACALTVGVCTIPYVSFRLGAQHGINVFERWLFQSDPDLHEQVDTLFKKCL